MAVCVAVIGKENYPLFLRTVCPEEELKFHYTVHTSLDVVEEKVSSLTKSSNDPRELYLGLLYPTEDYKVYGYVTNTKVKFVVVVETANTSLRDNEIRTSLSFLGSDQKDRRLWVQDCPATRCANSSLLQLLHQMFRKLHVAYTDMFCNPFYNPGENITSRGFERTVTGMMKQD